MGGREPFYRYPEFFEPGESNTILKSRAADKLDKNRISNLFDSEPKDNNALIEMMEISDLEPKELFEMGSR